MVPKCTKTLHFKTKKIKTISEEGAQPLSQTLPLVGRETPPHTYPSRVGLTALGGLTLIGLCLTFLVLICSNLLNSDSAVVLSAYRSIDGHVMRPDYSS